MEVFCLKNNKNIINHHRISYYKTGVINLATHKNQDVREFYLPKNKKTNKVLDFSNLDIYTKRCLIDFIDEILVNSNIKMKTIHSKYILPMIALISILNNERDPSLLSLIESNSILDSRVQPIIPSLRSFMFNRDESGYIISLENNEDSKISNYYKGKNSNTNVFIDLRDSKSDVLVAEVNAFVNHVFNLNNVSAKNVHALYIMPFIELLNVLKGQKLQSLLDVDFNSISNLFNFKTTKNKSFKNQLELFLFRYYDTSGGFDLDVWDLQEFNLSKERLNGSRNRNSIKFDKISDVNKENKTLVKKYIRHLIVGTDLSISTIDNLLSKLSVVINYFELKPFSEITREDVLVFYDWLDSKFKNTQTFNVHVYKTVLFFEYLELNRLINNTPFYKQDTKKNLGKNLKESAIDKFIINQIFGILDKVDIKLTLMFLLMYTTGMRISESCQVKMDCLQRTDNGCFIVYYSQKMKKDVTNVIPEKLYNMIFDFRQTLSPNQEFLFESTHNKPYQATTFSEKFNKALTKFDIKDSNGLPYRFKAHDYRHTMGAKMMDLNIPFQYIQKQLHHESPEMTVSYIEYTNKRKIKKMNEFVNINGEISPLKSDFKLSDEIQYAEYMREHINAQMLPNGVCAKPVKLGKCPHANSCLTCPDFRTSVDELDVHKEQLCNIDEYIEIANKNGWIMQVESNLAVKENLIKIVSKLENIKMESGK